jgi:HK97 family phage major capsid protein
MTVARVAEGAAIPIDTVAYTTTNLKPVKYGVRPLITKEMMEDGKWDLMLHNIKTAGREMADNETSLIITALDDAANTVSGGAAITMANIARAIQYLEDSDFEATDMLLGPEVANDLRNIDIFVEAQKLGSREMMQTGFIGTIFGMNVHVVSGNLITSTTSYIIDREQAFVIAEKRPVTVERYDDVTHDLSGAVVTQRITVGSLRTSAICKITTT